MPENCETYPAITVWQPWATLIAIGAKPFEFRGWPAPRRLVGKRIAIHAGARPARRAEIAGLLARLQTEQFATTGLHAALALKLLEAAHHNAALLPLSSIVCLATLGAPLRDSDLEAQLGLPSVNDSDRVEHSNWGWPLSEVEPLTPPVPATGRQGWWTWRRERVDA